LRAAGENHTLSASRALSTSLFRHGCGKSRPRAGTADFQSALFQRAEFWKEATMPVFILWAVPAAIVLAGGTYLVFLR
jgi:hypothetical protein